MKFKETTYSSSSSDLRKEQIERILTPIQASLEKKMDVAFSTEEEKKAAKIAVTVCMEAFKEYIEFRMKHGINY